MNKVILMGRLTRDPEVRYSQGEQATAIARYTVAVDRRFRRDGDSQTADFIGCVAFGRQAEFAEKYLRKGTKIALTGRIQTGSYTNRDGQKVYTTDVVVEEQEFAVALGKGEDITSGEGEYKAVETFNDGTYDIPYYKIDPIAVTAENMDKVIIDGGFHTREDVYLNIR